MDTATSLTALVEVSRAVAATPARSRKVGLIADLLRTTRADDVAIVVAYLAGELRQRRTGVGWASLRDLPRPAAQATLTVAEVDAAFERIAAATGGGSQAARMALLSTLFGAATSEEQDFLRQLATGELRQGALDGAMTGAIAKAFALPLSDVRQAVMLRGELPAVAAVAATEGAQGLATIDLRVGRAVQPMLAQSAPSVAAAMAKLGGGPVAVEWKLDGIRVQAHREGDQVSVFTRTLDDITARVPEIVEAVAALEVRDVVLDGEAIALDARGRARPFQETAARTGSRLAVGQLREKIPLTFFVFDVLHLDGRPLLALPAEQRQRELERVVPGPLRVPRLVSDDPGAAAGFFADAVARGHEGVVMKSLAAPYEAGRRGAGWVKVKPRHTLDLVVLAAEWGHGRRRGTLSNLHLGARDAAGGFVMLGKTFKGLTDEMLGWQTREFLARETHRDSHTVHVRPELVVEIAFDGVQRSPRYPGGVALRFARVLRYRPDKTADQADLIDDVLAIHEGARPPVTQDSFSDCGQT
ncbi:MAG TPA: ATP-dependent DNA ligase [Acidothermaceae bacterium]